MPGIVYRAVPKTTLPTSGASPPGLGTFLLTRSIDVSAYREITALVRIHNFYSGGAGAPTLRVDIFSEALSPDDAINDFASTTATATTTITLSSSISAPYLTCVSATLATGVAVRVSATTTDSTYTTTYVTFSVDLVAKS